MSILCKKIIAAIAIAIMLFGIIGGLATPASAVDRVEAAQTNETSIGRYIYHSAESIGLKDFESLDEIVIEDAWTEWEDGWIITAYCSCPICCGKWSQYKGLTASGMTIQEGVTIACDPSIPFGTVLEIEGLGERICMDRGSAIIGKHIDLYFETHEEACEWGLQKRSVRIRVDRDNEGR